MKKKMKKLFSKFTVLVLLVATLVPYVNIPTVEADTNECSEGQTPEYHVNYYFFLHAETPFSWLEMFSRNKVGQSADKNNTTNSLTTNYYTEFLYTFPKDGSKIVFEDEGFVKITNSSNVNSDFNAGKEQYIESWTAGQFYNELGGLNKMQTYSTHQAYSQHAYQKGGTENNGPDNRVVTYLFHGDWAHLGDQIDPTQTYFVDLNHLNISNNNAGITGTVEQQTAATIFLTPDDASLSKLEIGSPVLSAGLKIDREQMKNGIINFNEKQETGVVATTDVQGRTLTEPVINLAIKRTYQLSDIVDINKVSEILESDDRGAKDADGNYLGHGTSSTAAGYIKAKYNGTETELWLPQKEGEYISALNADASVGERVGKQATVQGNKDYWLIAPTLYQMTYYVCKDSGTPVEGEVTLSYNANKPEGVTGNVTGMPENLTQTKGSEFTISDKKPELEGYKFKSWNISAKCDEQRYEPSYKLGELENDTPLFACWVSTSTTEPGKTGVLTYTGLFAGIIALAGGSYYLIKKKNLFKKI